MDISYGDFVRGTIFYDRFPDYEEQSGGVDTEAIAWAYNKLLAYGVGNTNMDNAMMLDRLNAMLQGE